MRGLRRSALFTVLALFFCWAAVVPAQAAGPDEDALRQIVQARLSSAMDAGLVEISKFRAMGGAPDPAGGRVAYYSARLRMLRDHDFGDWGGQTLSTLAAVLGAGRRGITGATRGGNHAGDELGVNGAIQLVERGGEWQALHAAPEASSTTIDPSGPGGGARRLLDSMEAALNAVPRAAGTRGLLVMEEELSAAWRNIEGRLARLEQGYPLAGGAPGSEYERLAAALARVSRPPGGPAFVALPSAGSVENLRMLGDGRAVLAFAQSDVAALAQQERRDAAADIPALPQLRALASLYPEAVHVVVPAASPVQSMADLAGRRIAIGAEGSGARITAEAVLAAHGLPPQLALRETLPPAEAAAALAGSRVDALMAVTLAPAAAVLRLSDAGPVRLLPLEPGAVQTLTRGETGLLIPFEIRAGTYPGQGTAISSVATPALLVSTTALTEAEALSVLRALFQTPGLAEFGGPAALQIRPSTARAGITLPLHTGADRFFRETPR